MFIEITLESTGTRELIDPTTITKVSEHKTGTTGIYTKDHIQPAVVKESYDTIKERLKVDTN